MLREFFGEREFIVESEHEGDRGLARALDEQFDLMILDAMLPGMNGFEALRRLRERSQLPVLMLTGMADRTERVRGLELGADDYVLKPFGADELLARVRAILRRSALRANPPQDLQVGDLRLLPGTGEAFFRGRNLGLTAMECEILKHLMQFCGQVVSRDDLTFQLYNRPASPFDRAVDTHVSRIRRKMGEGRDMILSVRGTGYQLRYAGSSESH